MKETILVVGSNGQIGTELVAELRKIYGTDYVVASDLKAPAQAREGPFEELDILNKQRFHEVVKKHGITQVYLLAALLSATAEQRPLFGWQLNMDSLLTVLEAAVEYKFTKVYWPSSIAVFGPTTPAVNTPRQTIMEPNTIYGITKSAGELLCQWYYEKRGVDVRSIRYPGLIGWKSAPGGGTTDYAVHIYHEALKSNHYTSFLGPETTLPMMYMPDALRGTISLMEAPAERVKVRTAYNLAGFSFNPEEIAASIRHYLPGFTIDYAPDFRQAIANSWPKSIDDTDSRNDWGWKPEFLLNEMTRDMLKHLAPQYGVANIGL